MAYVVPVIIGIAVAIALLLASFLLLRPGRKEGRDTLHLLQNQLNESLRQTIEQMGDLRRSVTETIQNLTNQVTRGLTDTNQRLDSAGKVIGDLRQQLGHLENSSARMLEIGKDMTRLEEILKPPKLRGILGELLLADLIAQILPTSHYKLQYRFKGGETVDAVILMHAGMVAIDAKFPLESFRKIMAAENEDERTRNKKAFVSDIKGHIDNIAQKYIRPDENTFDFAFMYIPAENVYYETIIKDKEFGGEMDLFEYTLKKKVIPVSPNSFYAYLQTIVIGLKGMQIEEKSREMMNGLSRLQKEFGNFSEAFKLVGQHLDNSVKRYNEAEKRLGKVEAKIEQIDGFTRGFDEDQSAAPADNSENISFAL